MGLMGSAAGFGAMHGGSPPLAPPGFEQPDCGGWTSWLIEPPTFKAYRPDVVELWWPQLGNETHHARVADLQAFPEWNVAGVWWRSA